MRFLLTLLIVALPCAAEAAPPVGPIGPPQYSVSNRAAGDPTISQSSTDLCKSATSAGGGGMSFYFSVGLSFRDEACTQIRQAKELQNLGLRDAAIQVMCENDAVRLAMKRANTPCEAVKETDPADVIAGK